MKILICCFSLMLLTTSTALAQFDAGFFTEQNSKIIVKPEFPRPGDIVTATLNDYSSNSYGAEIIWLLNGAVVQESDTARSISIQAGRSGGEQTIKAVLVKQDGIRTVLQKSFTPFYLDIVIEPQTRVPDFYQGRPLPSIGSTINATALIDTQGLSSNDLVYVWKINRKVIGGGGMRGQNRASFITPIGKKSTLSLRVSKLDGTTIASRAVSLPSVRPTILFYKINPLYGITNKPIDEQTILISKTLDIKAEPYNLDINTYNNPSSYNWKINGNTASVSGGNPYEVTIQRSGSFKQALLEFNIRDSKEVLQSAKAGIKINI